MNLYQTRKQRQNDKFVKRAEAFSSQALEVLHVFLHDPAVLKRLELKHGVKMTNMEWDFLKDQRGQRKMYCEDFVDQKWMKTMERRRRDMQALDRMREDAEREK